MAKWQMSDAAAKRITAAWSEDDSRGDQYSLLLKHLRADGFVGRSSVCQLLSWIANHRPAHCALLLSTLAHKYESLRENASAFMGAFDALSLECGHQHDLNHYHQPE